MNGQVTSPITNIQGDLNLQSFRIGSTTYQTNDYVSGIGANTTLTSAEIGYLIQPGTFLNEGNSIEFYGGTTTSAPPAIDDAVSYLTSGERGLSFSTGLNFRANHDDAVTLDIEMSFNSDPTLSARPTFIIGDAAVGESDDILRFYNTAGPTDLLIAEVRFGESEWSNFSDQVVDRVPLDAQGTLGPSDNDQTLQISLLTFQLEETDFVNGFTHEDWDLIDRMSISIPETGAEPKTDYAFIGVDAETVSSPLIVVPEPNTWALVVSFLALTSTVLQRRR